MNIFLVEIVVDLWINNGNRGNARIERRSPSLTYIVCSLTSDHRIDIID